MLDVFDMFDMFDMFDVSSENKIIERSYPFSFFPQSVIVGYRLI